MKLNRLMAAVAGMAILGISAMASAATVTYSTVGAFTSSGTNVSTNGGMTITFQPVLAGLVTVPPPSNASLGTFEVSGTTSGTFNDNFTLTVTQTNPTSGTGSFTATMSGTITGTSSALAVTFNTPYSFNIDTVSYTLASPFLPLVPPTTNNGDTTVEASITTSVPTPASALAGSALLGLLGISKVRKHRNMI